MYNIHPWVTPSSFKYPNNQIKTGRIPCAMDAIVKQMKKEGKKPPFALMIYCRCPKCRIGC